MFKAMYGPGTKTQDLLYEFKKLRNIKDLQKVITEFGERKGMIGGSHDLNWWIKDELKDKDIEVFDFSLDESYKKEMINIGKTSFNKYFKKIYSIRRKRYLMNKYYYLWKSKI